MRLHRSLIVGMTTLLLALPATAAIAQDESPTPESPTPDPLAALAESDFADIFPSELGGLPWDQVIISVGQESLEVQTDEEAARFQALLEDLGATIDDVATANASRLSEDFTEYTAVAAFKVVGVEADRLLEAFVPVFAQSLTEPIQEDGEVAGKPVVILYDASVDGFFGEAQPFQIYASDEIVWLVSATEPLLTDAFEMLP